MNKQLLDKFFKGQCTEEEAEQVETWLSGPDTALLDELMNEKWSEANEPVRLTPRKSKRWYGAVAAAIIGTLALVTLCWQPRTPHQPFALKWDTLVNKTNTIQQLRLSDGTEVWLNSNSSLTYHQYYNGLQRELWLKGEAYFQVVKDDRHPFLVHAGSLTTTVLGTAFNISTANKADGSIQVSLIEGKVAVSSKDVFREILLPGQMLQYAEGKTPQLLRFAKDEVLDWKRKKIFFDNTMLGDALARLQQRYNCRIVLEDSILCKKKISGEFSRDMSLENILSTMEYVHNITFVRVNESTYQVQKK
ncbi:FecR domain-containing protein [Chitinophaga pendula]|uniref:FecR family protein n=1 Tax=Chitinophaga TaxID=79328 RepID=UPI000BAEF488|nr:MULTISPECIES: FecR domain-containing protein [Chitinophaga]ASZ10818.1 hypothetical protein CK934_07425 [Chitinophaga sp. MD30]UCJ06201.1 FecR domain-containing protein [Chitinophaga pendula]